LAVEAGGGLGKKKKKEGRKEGRKKGRKEERKKGKELHLFVGLSTCLNWLPHDGGFKSLFHRLRSRNVLRSHGYLSCLHSLFLFLTHFRFGGSIALPMRMASLLCVQCWLLIKLEFIFRASPNSQPLSARSCSI
jgi:hypothetical protein